MYQLHTQNRLPVQHATYVVGIGGPVQRHGYCIHTVQNTGVYARSAQPAAEKLCPGEAQYALKYNRMFQVKESCLICKCNFLQCHILASTVCNSP